MNLFSIARFLRGYSGGDMTTSYNNSTIPNDRQLPEGDAAARKRLFRSDTNKIISGVAGGMADYLNLDATIVRLLWVLVTLFTGGAAFWVYLALWLFLPIGDNARGQVADPAIKMDEKSMGIIAWVLIGLGVLWLLSNFGILPTIWAGFSVILKIAGPLFWPLVLIAGGWLILTKLGYTDNLTRKVKDNIPEGENVKASVKNGYHTVRGKTPLKRSKDDRMLLGVCAGIAHWLNIDPIIVRILWGIFTLGSLGTGVIIYVIMALIMPEDDSDGAIETVDGEVLDPIDVTS
jgi:phage shock protein PspC (stress-responsive transcriptional regulator)